MIAASQRKRSKARTAWSARRLFAIAHFIKRLRGTSTAREPDSEGFSASKQPFQLSDEARTNNFPVAVTDLIGRAAAARSLRDLVLIAS